MANRNKVLIVTATTAAGELEEKINKKLDFLPQYRVVMATSIFLGINILTTIVLELIEPCEQSTAEMTVAEILQREG